MYQASCRWDGLSFKNEEELLFHVSYRHWWKQSHWKQLQTNVRCPVQYRNAGPGKVHVVMQGTHRYTL